MKANIFDEQSASLIKDERFFNAFRPIRVNRISNDS